MFKVVNAPDGPDRLEAALHLFTHPQDVFESLFRQDLHRVIISCLLAQKAVFSFLFFVTDKERPK